MDGKVVARSMHYACCCIATCGGDQCQYGLRSRGPRGDEGPSVKPTGFLTNSVGIGRRLSERCKRDHKYVPLVGGLAGRAAVYPDSLCESICEGLAAEVKRRKTQDDDIVTGMLNHITDIGGACCGKFYDAITGDVLQE